MKTNPLLALIVAGWGIVLPQASHSQTSNLSVRDLTQLVTSERLRTYALARGLASGGPDLGTALDLKHLLQRQGFYMDDVGWQRIAAQHDLYPQLSYVPNMNGGSYQETLEFQGLTFRLRDDLVAEGGMAAGATYDGLLRYSWDSGRFIQLQAQVGGLYAPGPDLSSTRGRIAVCSRNHLVDWHFLDLCFNHFEDHRELQDFIRDEASIGFSTLFERGQTRHQLGATVSRTQIADITRDHLEVELDSVWLRTATRISLEAGAPQGDEEGAALSASAEIRWPLKENVLGLGAAVSQSPETQFLGQSRRDHSISLTGLIATRGNLVLSVSYTQTKSTLGFFENDQFSFGVSYSFQ